MPGVLCAVGLCSRLIDPVLHWQVHRDHPDLTSKGRVFGKWWKLSFGCSPCCLQLVLLLELIATHCFVTFWKVGNARRKEPSAANGQWEWKVWVKEMQPNGTNHPQKKERRPPDILPASSGCTKKSLRMPPKQRFHSAMFWRYEER